MLLTISCEIMSQANVNFNTIAIIPARYASTRFPGKPLACETGKPLIQHVYEQTSKAKLINRVIVATDDQRIFNAVKNFGGDVAMTRLDHPNGTSRIFEVAQKIVQKMPADDNPNPIIVNVQGDEPEIDPNHIDLAVNTLAQNVDTATLGAVCNNDEDITDTNIVKVVLDKHGKALYFSRSVIPHNRDNSSKICYFKHIGLYVYRYKFLCEYVKWQPTPLEMTEKLEQLRILENGYSIAVAIADVKHHGIDTPQQYADFVKRRQSQKYSNNI